ncbi:hypothetical protein FOZ63_016234, partial [Perkinsus olseni]
VVMDSDGTGSSPASKKPRGAPQLPYAIPLEEAQAGAQEGIQWTTKAIGSYSWDTTSTLKEPRIVVPGLAPVYSPAKRSFTLQRETRHPSNYVEEYDLKVPTESILHVMSVCQPSFDWSAVDLVTDRNNLRKLLRFLEASPDAPLFPDAEESFEIIVDVPSGRRPVAFTCDLRRDAPAPLGFGHAFEERLTTVPEVAKTLRGYFRLILLDINGFKVVVRTEVDALESPAEGGAVPEGPWKPLTGSATGQHYRRCGDFDAADGTVVEMKSKSAFFPDFPWRSTFYQMLLGKVDKLVLGWHKKGHFQPPKEYSYAEVQSQANADVDKRLSQLGALLKRVVHFVKQAGIPKALKLVWDGGATDLVIEVRHLNSSEEEADASTLTCKFFESYIQP